MPPKYDCAVYDCKECGTRMTVSLEDVIPPGAVAVHSGCAITWCENGHVVVWQNGVGKMIYNFAQGE